MAEKVKTKVIVLEPIAKSAKELVDAINGKGGVEIVTTKTPEDAFREIVPALPCMLVACIMENSDVPSRVQLFKRLEVAIKQQGLKIYVVTPIKNRQLADLATQKMGVADFIIEPMPLRTMQFKANLQLKAVENFRKQQEMKKLAGEKIVFKKSEEKKGEEATGTEVKAQQKPALQTGKDTFLFKNSGVKKSGKKFVVELEGPAPDTGEWVQHEDKGDAQAAWRWVPKEDQEKQKAGKPPMEEAWVHKGEKPVFNEAAKKWSMSSEAPSLALESKGKQLAQKIGLDDKGEVFVAEDSAAAEENVKKNHAQSPKMVEREKREAAKKEKESKNEKSDPSKDADKSAKDKLASLREDPADKPGEFRNQLGKTEEKKVTPPSAKDKLAALREDPASDPGEFRNQLSKGEEKKDEVWNKKEQAGKPSLALKEKQDKLKEAAGDVPGDAGAPGKAPPSQRLNPVDFLKKKKEERIAKSSKAEETPEEREKATPGKSEEKREKKGKREAKPGSAEEVLARLNSKLGRTQNKDEEESEDPLAALQEGGEEGGEGDEAGIGGTGRPKMHTKAGGQGGKGPAKALRNSPAERQAGVRNRVKEAAEKTVKLKEERQRTIADIQALLRDPIPEEISEEEELELREELGLKDRPEIKPQDLVRRKRVQSAKDMKERLTELDRDILDAEEEELGDAFSANHKGGENKEIARRKGDLSAEKLTGIRRALDGEEEVAEAGEEIAKRVKSKEQEKKEKAGRKDRYVYMPKAELQPLGNAWENAGPCYLYVDAKTRYKGFAKIDELLPMWFYTGDEVPKLLDKTQQWQFVESLPRKALTAKDLPSEARDYLLGLRDRLQKGGAGEKADPFDALRSKLGSEESGDAEATEEGSSENFTTKKKEKREESGDPFDTLRSKLGSEDEEELEEDSSENITAKKKEKREESGDPFDSLRSKLGSEDSEETEEDSSENFTAKKKEKRGESGDPFDTLRSKLGSDDSEETENEEESGSDDFAAKKKGKQAGKEGKNAKPSSALERLKAALDDDTPLDEEEPGAAEDRITPDDNAEPKARKKNPASTDEKEQQELARLKDNVEAELNEEEKKEKAGVEAEAESLDPMERLRARLEAETTGEESSADAKPEKADGEQEPSEEKKKKQQAAEAEADPFAALREKVAGEASAPEAKAEKTESEAAFEKKLDGDPRLQSEGVKKFLEKRKQKEFEAEKKANLKLIEKNKPKEDDGSITSGYLGVFVALSDAFATDHPSGRALGRVLAALQESFQNCVVYCTALPDSEGKADVIHCPNGGQAPAEKLLLVTGLTEPIQRSNGGTPEILGYLYIGAAGGRQSFNEAEEKTFRRVGGRLWPLLLKKMENGEAKAA